MKLFFKIIITAILAVLFLEILISVLAMANIITPEIVQNNAILQYAFSISEDMPINRLTFNPLFETGVAIIFGLLPLISFFKKKS